MSTTSTLAAAVGAVIVAASLAAPSPTASAYERAHQPATMRLEITGPITFDFGFRPIAIDSHRRVAGALGLGVAHAALKRGDSIHDLGPGVANAMDEHGRLFGTKQDALGVWQAVMWERQGHAVVLSPEGLIATAEGANDRGEAVGHVVGRATYWYRGRTTDLGWVGVALDISNTGVIVGAEYSTGIPRPAVWQSGTLTILSSNEGSANDVNDAGQVAGTETIGNPRTSYARLWHEGRTVDLGAGFPSSFAHAINQPGDVAGMIINCATNGCRSSAAVWRRRDDGSYEPVDLNTLLRPEAVEAGWWLGGASGINDRGDVVGSAYNRILCDRGTCDGYGFILTHSRRPDDYPIPSP